MNFVDAIAICFKKYVDFSGRARRAEFWYWTLFVFIVGICTAILDVVIFPYHEFGPLNSVWSIATFLPGLAVTVRRLHDVDKRGWWILLILVPIIGWLVLLYWYIQRGTTGANRFGPDPLSGEAAVETPASV